MRLHKQWLLHVFPCSNYCRVESLQMSHLKYQVIRLCQLNEGIRLLQGSCHGFLYEHVNACRQKITSNLAVILGRHHHAGGINLANKFPVRCTCLA